MGLLDRAPDLVCRRSYKDPPKASSSTMHMVGGARQAPSRRTMRSCWSPLSTSTCAASCMHVTSPGRMHASTIRLVRLSRDILRMQAQYRRW